MIKGLRTLGTVLSASALAFTGCGEPEKNYLVDSEYVEPWTQSHPANDIWSPAKDRSCGGLGRFYSVVSESELRELGLNPENQIEFNWGEWRALRKARLDRREKAFRGEN